MPDCRATNLRRAAATAFATPLLTHPMTKPTPLHCAAFAADHAARCANETLHSAPIMGNACSLSRVAYTLAVQTYLWRLATVVEHNHIAQLISS